MARIEVLSELVANQIAAGEVVERPASAVKELLENAVDAGATEIQVWIDSGGLARIDVQDNGSGMAPDEVELAFIRHATSKLRSIEDLRRLQSLGFRGEALPSIASVSKVTVKTREADLEGGVELRIEGGQVLARAPVGCPPGTRITVADLFYNTPARLKFVRSLQTEAAHVEDVVAKAAAARPDVAFRLHVDGRPQWTSPGDGQLRSVFAQAFGSEAALTAVEVNAEHPDYTLTGLIALPEFSRSQRTGLWFIVNGRPVRSQSLQAAVVEACQEAMPKGRFGLMILSLNTDPTLVDVNVHPGKLEVRFSEERDVRDLFVRALRDAWTRGLDAATVRRFDVLGGPSGHVPVAGAGGSGASGASGAGSVAGSAGSSGNGSGMGRPGGLGAFDLAGRHAEGFPEAAPDRQAGAREGPARYASTARPAGPTASGYRQQSAGGANADDAAVLSRQLAFALQEPLQEPLSDAQSPSAARRAENSGEVPNAHGVAAKPTLRAVAQVLQMYVVAEDGDAVYLIDQHAAHERVLYERFRAAAQARGLQSLPLLVPLTIEVRPQDAEAIEAAAPSWTSSGLMVERFGDHAFVVRAIPHIWEGLDLMTLVQDVFADELAQRLGAREERTGERAARSWQEQLILRSCKAAVKANQRLSLPELDALLASLALLENPFTCPHGRPTAIRLTRTQLEREFRRTL